VSELTCSATVIIMTAPEAMTTQKKTLVGKAFAKYDVRMRCMKVSVSEKSSICVGRRMR